MKTTSSKRCPINAGHGRLAFGLASILTISSCVSVSQGVPWHNNSVAIGNLTDASANANKSEEFQKQKKLTCNGVANALQRGDLSAVVPVNAEPPSYQDLSETNPNKVTEDCQLQSKTDKLGTFTCPAFEMAGRIFEGAKQTPVLIVQVITNEREKPCPSTWRSVASKIIARGGSVLVLSSSNAGNTPFNANLKKALEGLSTERIKFYGGSEIEGEVKRMITKARRQQPQ